MMRSATQARRVFVAGRIGPTSVERRRALAARTDELIEEIRHGGRDTAANIAELVRVRRELIQLQMEV